MRAPDMGHWRAIKQGEGRSFTVFPGQAPKPGNALVRTPSATFQAGHASSILLTRSIKSPSRRGISCGGVMRARRGQYIGPYRGPLVLELTDGP